MACFVCCRSDNFILHLLLNTLNMDIGFIFFEESWNQNTYTDENNLDYDR